MSRVWVVNSSPLILLGKIDRIALLGELSDELIVPEAVAREVGAKPEISQFIETLVRPHVVKEDLAAAYRQMAAEEAREAEAHEWAEALAGDVADEAR